MKSLTSTFIVLLVSVTFSLISLDSPAQEKTLTFPNSSVKMTVSEGYETSSENGYSGLVNATEGNQFVITKIPAPYEEVIKQFTPKALATTGVVVTDSKPHKTNGMNGTLHTATQSQGDITMNKYILIFGDIKNTYMVMAVFSLDTPHTEILGYLNTIQL